MSQFKLENEINASPGSLSRIESGQTNPSKETLMKIAEALKLPSHERSKLFGITHIYPTEEEKISARKSVEEYLKRNDVFAILIDELGFIVDASSGMFQLLNISPAQAENYMGKNLIEILIDQSLGIHNSLYEPEKIAEDELALFLLRTTGRENEQWYRNLMKQLSRFQVFSKILNRAKNQNLAYFPRESRMIKFKLDGKSITLISHFTKLEHDTRFELIDYIIKD